MPKPKDKPCWDVGIYQTMTRTATVRVSAWTREEALQMAVRGDTQPPEWTDSNWSARNITHTDDGGSVRVASCD